MKKKSILITGGSGFFGCSLLDMIAAGNWSDCHFTMLSRRMEGFLRQHPEYTTLTNVDFMEADVRMLDGKCGEFDYMIHAATPSVDVPGDEELVSIILDGTRSALAFAARCGVQKLLYISSGAVYGSGTGPFDETSPCKPVTPYGKAKLEAEQQVFASAVPSVVMRAFAFTGKHLRRDAHFAIGNFVADALARRDIVIKGDGTPLRSYMHSDDLARWMMSILLCGRAGRVYNCGSNKAVSIKQLAQKVNAVLNPSGRIEVLTPELPGAVPSCYVPDITRAERELGLKITVALEDAIKLSAGVDHE